MHDEEKLKIHLPSSKSEGIIDIIVIQLSRRSKKTVRVKSFGLFVFDRIPRHGPTRTNNQSRWNDDDDSWSAEDQEACHMFA